MADKITDRGQVRAMWQWARDLDRDNLLWREFCRPIEVETGSKEDLAIQLAEGLESFCPLYRGRQSRRPSSQLCSALPARCRRRPLRRSAPTKHVDAIDDRITYPEKKFLKDLQAVRQSPAITNVPGTVPRRSQFLRVMSRRSQWPRACHLAARG